MLEGDGENLAVGELDDRFSRARPDPPKARSLDEERKGKSSIASRMRQT